MSLANYEPRHFSHEHVGDAVVISVLEERLSEEQNLEEFGTELFAYIDQYDCRTVVLNCAQVIYASSSAIGKLITLHRRVNRVEGRLAICSLQASFVEILQAARLYDYFQTATTAEEAVALLQGDPE